MHTLQVIVWFSLLPPTCDLLPVLVLLLTRHTQASARHSAPESAESDSPRSVGGRRTHGTVHPPRPSVS